MSESGKWRCPYCDGLNDWQNEACEICGDGKRPDREPPDAPSAFPKTYTPKARPTAPEAPEVPEAPEKVPEPDNTPPTPSPDPEPPREKKKGHGLLWMLVIAALAFGGGKLLGGQMGRNWFGGTNATPIPTQLPFAFENPIQTVIPRKMALPVSTVAAAPTPLQVMIWNYRNATDAQIEDSMSLFFRGRDRDGTVCVLFMDPTGSHGGYMYSIDQSRYRYDMGSFVDEGSNTSLKLVNPEGETVEIQAIPQSDNPKTFKILSIGDKTFNNLLLKQKDPEPFFLSMALRAAHGETSADTQPTAAPSAQQLRLAVGSRGDEVVRLQQALIGLGYLNSRADGIFGPKTEQAVKKAQAAWGRAQTGAVDYAQYREFTLAAGVLTDADFQ